MPFFGVPIRNGLPIGLGSVAGFGVQQFDPSQLFAGGTVAGAWYDPSDLSTMFDSSAGTTPVAMPGQGAAVPVGLMLDKSQNGVGTNGAYRYNLLTYSQAFGNAAWVTASATKVSTTQTDPNGGSTAALITIASGGEFYQDATLTGGSGSFSVYVKKPATGGATAIRLTTNNRVAWNTGLSTKVTLTSDWQRVVLSGALVSSGSFLRVDITCRDATSAIDTDCIGDVLVAFAQLETSLTASTYQHIDATWYGAIPGNHAIAFNDTTARPELRARVNLLTYSEEFDNGAWTKAGLNAFGSGSVANTTATLDPLGGNTADYIQENSANAPHYVFSNGGISVNATTYQGFVYAKAAQRSRLWVGIWNGTNYEICQFDLANGVILQEAVPGIASIQPAGNGWWKCGVSRNIGTVTTFLSFGPYINANISTLIGAASNASYTGDGTSGIYIWGADLRPANIGANVPAYQRIADANTYDTSGFPLYLLFEGAVGQRGMYTPANLNLSGTDKVSVFAGVRKLSDAAQGVVAELSATIASNNGTFLLAAPDGATQTYGWDSKGTAQVDAVASSFVAPITNVLAGTADIAGDSCIIRVNGAVADTETGDQGTGNFGTYPLFIGARNNSSLWFNGHLHSLIIAGSAVSAGNISATEQWVAGKTGLVLP